MSGLYARPRFTGFGPVQLHPARRSPPLWQARGPRPRELRAQVRRLCPRRPGVYGMIDARGELIYVGKAKNLRARLLCYFRPRSRDAKAGRILENTHTLVWEFAPSEFAALLRELELIQRWQPRFNVQGQPHRRRRTYVCLGRPPAPYLFVQRRPPADLVGCFGPVPSGPTLNEAVRRLNDCFQLRDCTSSVTMVFADQGELFPIVRTPGCLRAEIGTCSAPCAAGCSRGSYTAHVQAARAFLAGEDSGALSSLESAMARAAQELAYERAAALRDKLEPIRWLHDHLERLRSAQERHSFVYPVTSARGRTCWYLIHRGQVRAALREPRTDAERQQVTKRMEAVFEQPLLDGPLAAPAVDGILLVAGWFRRHPEELQKTLAPSSLLAFAAELVA